MDKPCPRKLSIVIKDQNNKLFDIWISRDVTFKSLLQESCSYFRLDKSEHILGDEKGTIWPSLMKVIEPVNAGLISNNTVYVMEKKHVHENKNTTSPIRAQVHTIKLKQTENHFLPAGGSFDIFERLWFIFTAWNSMLNPSRPFLMSKTQCQALLRRCSVTHDWLPTPILEVMLNRMLRNSCKEQKYFNRSMHTKHARLDFARFCTFLFKVAQRLFKMRDDLDKATSKQTRFLQLLQGYIFPLAPKWNVKKWQESRESYQRNFSLIEMLRTFKAGLLSLFSFYSVVDDTVELQPGERLQDVSGINFKSFSTFCHHYDIYQMIVTRKAVAESYISSLSHRGLFLEEVEKTMPDMNIEHDNTEALILELCKTSQLNFNQFLLSIVHLANQAFVDEEYIKKIREIFGNNGFQKFLRETGHVDKANNKGSRSDKSVKQYSNKFDSIRTNLRRAMFDNPVCVKLFLFLEAIVTKLNYMEMEARLMISRKYKFYSPELLRCSILLQETFNKVYKLLVFDYETAINILEKTNDQVTEQREKMSEQKLALVATKLLYKKKSLKLDFLDILRICSSIRSSIKRKQSLDKTVADSWKTMCRINSRGAIDAEISQGSLKHVKNNRRRRLSIAKDVVLRKHKSTTGADDATMSPIFDSSKSIFLKNTIKSSACEKPFVEEFSSNLVNHIQALENGATLMKHTGRLTNPHYRFFWYENGYLCWTISPATRKKTKRVKKLNLSTLKDVRICTEKTKSSKVHWLPSFLLGVHQVDPSVIITKNSKKEDDDLDIIGPNCPFILKFDRRSLMLEAPNIKIRDIWVLGLRSLIQAV